MARKKRSRLVATIVVLAVTGAGLVAAFWPRPMLVDMGHVTRAPMLVTINEEGRTRVRDAYVVSTPVAGRLLRVTLHPGDLVEEGKTLIAQMRPTNPAALDVRTREQANAAVDAAEAALRVAKADYNVAAADRDLAKADLERARALTARGATSEAALDRALHNAQAATARVDTSEAAIAMRQAELDNARARLIGFDDRGLAAAALAQGDEIPLIAPTNGRVLQVFQQSETTLPAGAPVMEIGNTDRDLEVAVALLSTDAVQVQAGNRVIIDDWGGTEPLAGEVLRVDPYGVTKYSALGVEEQRVNTVIGFTGDAAARASLGHGFRVEVRIVVWENPEALTVPSAALFRAGSDWAVFAIRDGQAVQQVVEIGRNNGVQAEVLGGLGAGDAVVLYPSSALVDGALVAARFEP